MKCERCNKNEATVHMTYINNGKREDHHLCEACSRQQEAPFNMGKQSGFWQNDFFKSLLEPYVGNYGAENACPSCGMTYREFNETGRFGCPTCYTHFGNQIQPMLERLQGATRHVGKVPLRGTGVFTTSRQVQRLKQELSQALSEEAYERAAELRDEIRALEDKTVKQKKEEG